MKIKKLTQKFMLFAAAVVALNATAVAGALLGSEKSDETKVAQRDANRSDTEETRNAKGHDKQVEIVPVETGDADGSAREVAWLGIATEEASEVLSSQLGLDSGVGLVVTHVARKSPAAEAGLLKNDVLVQFDKHPLVHPEQLRKLVQVRAPGDSVKLSFYRAGEKQSVSSVLGKAADKPWIWNDESLSEGLGDLKRTLRDLRVEETIRDQAKQLGELFENLKIDKEQVTEDVRRGMEEARKSIEEALKRLNESRKTRGATTKLLEDLAQSDVELARDATVTVRSTATETKTGFKRLNTMVRTDDEGTYLLMANPKKHLTAHDKTGKLLFDGDIETEDQLKRVPKEVLQKVKPLIEEFDRRQVEKF